MRTPTYNEQLKINVYKALTAPDTTIINAGDHWIIDIMREAPETFSSTDEMLDNIQYNMEETPLYAWETARDTLEDTYNYFFGKYYTSDALTEDYWIDYSAMNAAEISHEGVLSEVIDFMSDWIMTEREREHAGL